MDYQEQVEELRKAGTSQLWQLVLRELDRLILSAQAHLERESDQWEMYRDQGKLEAYRRVRRLPELLLEDLKRVKEKTNGTERQ